MLSSLMTYELTGFNWPVSTDLELKRWTGSVFDQNAFLFTWEQFNFFFHFCHILNNTNIFSKAVLKFLTLEFKSVNVNSYKPTNSPHWFVFFQTQLYLCPSRASCLNNMKLNTYEKDNTVLRADTYGLYLVFISRYLVFTS